MADTGRRETSAQAGAPATTPREPETWGEALALLPRRAVFVVVALVQIAVELAVRAVQSAWVRSDDGHAS